MIPVLETPRKSQLPWGSVIFFGLLVLAGYLPVLRHLVRQCYYDADMGHALFVPIIAGFIVWQKREELMALKTQPNWWGLLLVVWGGIQLTIATLGTELFTARVAFLITLIGVIWTLC